MSLKITDYFNGLKVSNATLKIEYTTVNRTGFFDTGLPKFSANVYLEYSNDTQIYRRDNLTIENLNLNEWTLEDLYGKMKERDEFKEATDNIPVYIEVKKEDIETQGISNNSIS